MTPPTSGPATAQIPVVITTDSDRDSKSVPSVEPHFAQTSAEPTARVQRSIKRRANWRQGYARLLVLTDLAVLAVVMLGAQLIWLGGGNAAVPAGGNAFISSDVSYWLVSAVIVAGWAWMLSSSTLVTTASSALASRSTAVSSTRRSCSRESCRSSRTFPRSNWLVVTS